MMMEFRVLFLIWCSIAATTLGATKTQNIVPTDGSQSLSLDKSFHSLHESGHDEKRGKNPGWSGWSEWSTCSRSCDGGVAHQLRRCHSAHGCKGEPVRHKICNMQPCPDSQDFRAHQCSAYDDVPYDGALYKWSPHYDYNEPCALTCRGKPAHLSLETMDVGSSDKTSAIHSSDDATGDGGGGGGGEDRQAGDTRSGSGRQVRTVGQLSQSHHPVDEVDGGGMGEEEALEDTDEPSVIVQLAARVQDGTRCRTGSLDMCIQGKCQRVGCDLKIGSTKKVDGCGVCGGDGTSCSQPLYYWDISENSLCSVTCGGGYKMAKATCKNRQTGSDVDESLCTGMARPEPTVLHCNTHLCPPKWIAEEWGGCTKVCGSGFRERRVVCAEEMNGIKTRVADGSCPEAKPPTRELCNVHECPKWETSEWSGCSVSCGKGIQVRNVECVMAKNGALSAHCDPHTKPPAMQTCTTGISCNKYDLKHHQPDEGDDDDDEEMEDDEPYQQGPRTLPLTHRDAVNPRAERLVSESQQKVPNEATFVLESEWGPCSVTCGEGIRKRPYRCKIFLEFSKTTPTLNDTLCPGPKPSDEIEKCYLEPCSMTYGYDPSFPRDTTNRNPTSDFKVQAAVPGKTYSWHEQGYTSCSASCLGGVEELIINCVRDDTGKVVSPFLCSQETKPEARVRTCNDHQCPPRWNVSEFSPCSKSCGIGIKTREVQCIHEVARGGENTMVVPNSMCPQPIPSDRQYCNVLDCPVRWEVSEWGKCSKNCGGGYKERRVECKQIMAQEHKVERPEAMCPGSRPAHRKACNNKQCAPENQRPPISASNSTYIQHDQKKAKVTLKVGGAAEVFYGVQVKVKCPVKGRFNRTKIHWTKDGGFLAENKRVKVSAKGALRILNITYRDSGIYTCHAGLSSVNLNVTVKPKVGDNVSINEYEKYRAAVEIRRNNPNYEQPGLIDEKNPRQRNRGRNRQKNIQNTDAMDNGGPYRSRSQMSPSDQTPSATSSGTRTVPMSHLNHLLASLQFLLWPFQRFSNSKGYHLLKARGQYYPPMDSAAAAPKSSADKVREFKVQHRQLIRDQVRQSPLLASTSSNRDDKLPLHYDDSDYEEAPLDRSLWNGRVIADGKDQTGSKRPRLDLRLGQKINDLFDASTKAVVLGHGTSKNVKFEWMITPWSVCSQPCGTGIGFRLRSAHCVVRLHNASQSVENVLCEDAGLELPDTIEKCGGGDCAKWSAEDWKPCFTSKCIAWHTAIQRRAVHCEKNGTQAMDQECDRKAKPALKRECYSEKCKGVWRMDAWSECDGVCDSQGVKRRTIRCVWYGTKRSAGEVCKDQPRPIVIKACKVPSCPQSSASTGGSATIAATSSSSSSLSSGASRAVTVPSPSLSSTSSSKSLIMAARPADFSCKDTSPMCSKARTVGLCKLHRFKQQCCSTCVSPATISPYP